MRSSDMVHESMKTLAKLCKIEKRGIGPSTLWAAIGIGLTLKDAAKKAYDAFEEKAKRRMEEKTTAIPLVQSSQPPPPSPRKKSIDTGIFGRMARPSKPRDGSELKINTKTSTASSKPKKKTSCDHCKASMCDRPFQSSICGHFACYKCFNAIFASESTKAVPNSGPCPTCSKRITKKSLKKMYLVIDT